MEIQLKPLKNKDILNYECELKKYIKNLIEPYTEKDTIEETERIYENMKTFTLDNSAIIIGAFDEKELLGFIWGYKDINSSTIIHINYFYINENYRNFGIGKKLLEEMENKVKTIKGITNLELFVDKKNKNGMNFYKHNNFEIKEICSTKIKLRKRI